MDGWSRKVEVKREQSWVGAGEEDENVRGRERKIDLPRAYLRYAFYSFLRSLARSLEPPFLRSFLPSLSFSLSLSFLFLLLPSVSELPPRTAVATAVVAVAVAARRKGTRIIV